MAKSRAARRRARKNNMQVPYARMRPGSNRISDWQIGSAALTSAGVLTGPNYTTGPGTWTLGNAITVANAVPTTTLAVVLPPGVAAGAPAIGRLRIDGIAGRIILSSATAATRYTVAVGIYISEASAGAAKYLVG